TENVLTHSMGYDRKSYSPLKQINKSNIKRLVPIWNASMMNDQGELAQPTVYNGVMYAINGKWTFAIDVETGRQIWRTPTEIESGITRAAFNRGGATIYNGKVFRVTIDNHVLAIDMKTGKQLWNQKFADSKDGFYATGGPIVANGVLISGVAGGESTTRGFLDGWDPDTGKKLWRTYTIPAPGEPGSETWPKNSDAWKYGGGPTWRSGSYDPELDLVYWGTGNAEPYDPRPREGIDMATGRPVLTDIYKRFAAGEEVEILPSRGTNAVPIAFNPNTGLVYASTWDIPRIQKLAPPKPQVFGAQSTGVDARQPDTKPSDVFGHFAAINPLTGEKKWDVPLTDLPSSAGMLVTGCGLVFTGRLTGEFIALDEDTGKTLWQFKTGSSVN